MSYQPLARKYRPRNFSDLIGQEAVALALSNAIKLERAPAAVIFSGVRGIGKTTIARLYAKALNCEDNSDVEPCDHCESCLAISGGFHEDVLEIDGASNNGVDEIRALKETVAYVSQRSKYKIYIIDEVHMLSISAFNALLKTLEEPPDKVVFIFATTEMQKIPQTIVGRCQSFYLQKMTLDATIKRLVYILETEKLNFDREALQLIAREGRGSMRDALTCLDQAIALGEGRVSMDSVSKFLVSLSSDLILEMLEALVLKDKKNCLNIIEQMDQAGTEFTEAVEHLARFTRHGFVIQSLGEQAQDLSLFDLSDAEEKKLISIIKVSPKFDLNRLFRSFISCRKDLDGSELDRFIFENYCLEWCLDPGLPRLDELFNKGFTKDSIVRGAKGLSPAVNPRENSAMVAEPVNSIKSNASVEQKPLATKSVRPNLLASLRDLENTEKKSPNEKIDLSSLGMVKASTLHENRKIVEFPKSWEDLIKEWKRVRPLEARKWEEIYVNLYSADRIEISVKSEGLIAKEWVDRDLQSEVRRVFKTLFAFHGEFIVSLLDEKSTDLVKPATESLLEVKAKEKDKREAEWLENAREHPLTVALTKNLGARLENVSLQES